MMRFFGSVLRTRMPKNPKKHTTARGGLVGLSAALKDQIEAAKKRSECKNSAACGRKNSAACCPRSLCGEKISGKNFP